MEKSQTMFEKYLAESIEADKGVSFPVKTGILERLLIKKAACDSLHPNPEDEFCSASIGPSYKIISDYQQQFVNQVKQGQYYYTCEPIIVERIHPDGYRIINGHHRWAAALLTGQREIPIQVVNLTHELDVKNILANSRHEKRAAIDLDEVIFRTKEEAPLEDTLSFPWNRLYKERIRLGIPALFHFLAKNGYDIWLYSSEYYSSDYIQNYFRKYHVKVDGVITAIGKRAKAAGDAGKKLEKMISDKYLYTVHIDNASVLQIIKGSKVFRDYPINGESADWSKEVMDAVTEIERNSSEETSR